MSTVEAAYEMDSRDHDANPPLDPVAAVQAAVTELARTLPALLEACDDPQALDLANLFYEVQKARIDLQGLERDLERHTAKALMADQVIGAGVRVERYRARDRKEWDHDAWKRDVRAKALRKNGAIRAVAVVTADGEALEVDLHQLLQDVQGVHGAGAPKVTGLRGLGLDASDYCRTEPGTTHVRVLRLADETETESSENDGD